MFYKGVNEETEAKAGVISLGPIAISVNELINSIKASLIVVPPVLFITIFFTKSMPSRNKTQAYDEKNVFETYNNSYSTKNHPEFARINALHIEASKRLHELERKKYPLPWWCVGLGWALVFLSVAASAFFTILYSFQWGGVKSRAWLIAFVLSFFESVILIQPLKVCFNFILMCVRYIYMFLSNKMTLKTLDKFKVLCKWCVVFVAFYPDPTT